MLCAGPQFWPQPTGMIKVSNTAVAVHEDLFSLQILSFPSITVRDHLKKAFKLFRSNIQKLKNNSLVFHTQHAVIVRVMINENGSIDPRMRLDTDESYQLRLNKGNNFINVNISSNSFCGSRHALETLLQMIWVDPYTRGLLILEEAFVEDAPRFRYRGLMLDTTQTYFPITDILRTIDGMAASKLNTFHWHTTNLERFSLQLNKVPRLDQYGIYENMYTPEDVRVITRHARVRGIRVLVDFNLLAYIGNAAFWGKQRNIMDLVPCIEKKPTYACDFRDAHILNIILEIYKEIFDLTGVDDIFYFGGSDAPHDCLAQKFNVTNPSYIWYKLTFSFLKKIESDNIRLPHIVLWSNYIENISTYLQGYYDKVIFQIPNAIWQHSSFSGSCVIISNLDKWELNSGYGTWYEELSTRYTSWQRVYEYRPWARNMTCIEGGEVIVWTSTLDANGLDAQIWPRGAAFAERLWSDRAESVTHSVQTRLNLQRQRLMNRGIESTPLGSMWCACNTIYC